jgi:uncharacterized protein DUF3311
VEPARVEADDDGAADFVGGRYRSQTLALAVALIGSGAPERPRETWRAWYLLLLIPFAALLWPPIYARETPEAFGFPFFYWYQLVAVPVAAALTVLVYVQTRAGRAAARERRLGR